MGRLGEMQVYHQVVIRWPVASLACCSLRLLSVGLAYRGSVGMYDSALTLVWSVDVASSSAVRLAGR